MPEDKLKRKRATRNSFIKFLIRDLKKKHDIKPRNLQDIERVPPGSKRDMAGFSFRKDFCSGPYSNSDFPETSKGLFEYVKRFAEEEDVGDLLPPFITPGYLTSSILYLEIGNKEYEVYASLDRDYKGTVKGSLRFRKS